MASNFDIYERAFYKAYEEKDVERTQYYLRLMEMLANKNLDAIIGPAYADRVAKAKDCTKEKEQWFQEYQMEDYNLKAIAGLKEVKDQFKYNIIAPTYPELASIYSKYRRDRGLQVLLYGPPGTGKTYIVKCLAGELKCKIAVVQIKDVMANLVGDGAKIIYDVFNQAKKLDRCIIFIDEIDAIASSRNSDESRYTKEQLTTLLTCMDGFTSQTKENQVRIIVAATNRPWALDSAVKRGGRFETQIYVPLPDEAARKKLVMMALRKNSETDTGGIPCAKDVTVSWLAEKFEGCAGADINAICRQMASFPMIREIRVKCGVKDEDKKFFITRDDCEMAMSKYIKSTDDATLVAFDLYRYGISREQYKKECIEKVRKELNGSEIGTETAIKSVPDYAVRCFNILEEIKKSSKEKTDKIDKTAEVNVIDAILEGIAKRMKEKADKPTGFNVFDDADNP